ncbi:unnamed protein product [Pleuronectes platessa]|uniref:Uncharacterized protein n=1 Tax=Pleuronectes platessa TaxID=8262 RepID=A0A9N7VM31_PLEPL|nr:unnamed protein product [Pleuronectes platessa]
MCDSGGGIQPAVDDKSSSPESGESGRHCGEPYPSRVCTEITKEGLTIRSPTNVDTDVTLHWLPEPDCVNVTQQWETYQVLISANSLQPASSHRCLLLTSFCHLRFPSSPLSGLL